MFRRERVSKVQEMGFELRWNADAQELEDSRWNTINPTVLGVKSLSRNLKSSDSLFYINM